MTGFFDRMLGRNPAKGSGSTAKDRLQFVLLHERVNIAPEKMREMKQEIIEVIAKYVPEIDPNSVDIAFEQSDRYNSKLVAEIPFTKSKHVEPVSYEDDSEQHDVESVEMEGEEAVDAPESEELPLEIDVEFIDDLDDSEPLET